MDPGATSSSEDPALEKAPEDLPHSTVILMAITVGVIVANIYYAQPLLKDIAKDFSLEVTQAGAVAMLSQAGTAVGMFLFVPLGDKFERRSLIVTLLLAAFVSLTLLATARNTMWLSLASFCVGLTGACVHVVVPFAANLASPKQRGKVVGTVVAGILFGVLLARTFSGAVGDAFGWRSVYGIAAVAMLALAAVVRTRLPVSRPEIEISWIDLMRSAWDLVVKHPALRESAALGALFFAAFSAFWTTLVFLLQSPAYRYEKAGLVAGVFGLIGAVGALGAPFIGHLAQKHGPRFTIRIALWLALVSFAFIGFTGKHLYCLIIGVIVMDLGVQSGHVSNQTRIYAIDPGARSRLNMVYMVCYFIGGGLGSWLGALAWHYFEWIGVAGFGVLAIALALLVEWRYGDAELPGGN